MDINQYQPKSGRVITESGVIVNPYDFISGDQGNIETIHKKIHEQKHFNATHFFTAVADNATARIRVVKGVGKVPHIVANITALGDCHYSLKTGTSYTSDGTEIIPKNNVVGSEHEAVSKVYHTPTIDVAGDVFMGPLILVGGRAGQALGGDSGFRNEIVLLADNSDLLIEITNKSGQARDISIDISFYE